MMAALKSLSDNSNISVMIALAYIDSFFFFFIKVEIFLVHGMMSDFQLQPEHSEDSVEILNFI